MKTGNYGWHKPQSEPPPCEVCGKPRAKGTDHGPCMEKLAEDEKGGPEDTRRMSVERAKRKAYLSGKSYEFLKRFIHD